MGSRVARRLADAGNEVIVWNRTRANAEELGRPVADTPAEEAGGAGVVITIVANHEAMRAVTEGDNGVAGGI